MCFILPFYVFYFQHLSLLYSRRHYYYKPKPSLRVFLLSLSQCNQIYPNTIFMLTQTIAFWIMVTQMWGPFIIVCNTFTLCKEITCIDIYYIDDIQLILIFIILIHCFRHFVLLCTWRSDTYVKWQLSFHCIFSYHRDFSKIWMADWGSAVYICLTTIILWYARTGNYRYIIT
jgi:hypothetical protein